MILFGNKVICRCNHVNIRSYWIRVGPQSDNYSDNLKKRESDIWIQSHDGATMGRRPHDIRLHIGVVML